MRRRFKAYWLAACQRGQGLTEYGLILFFVSTALFLAIKSVGSPTQGLYATINNAWSNVMVMIGDS